MLLLQRFGFTKVVALNNPLLAHSLTQPIREDAVSASLRCREDSTVLCNDIKSTFICAKWPCGGRACVTDGRETMWQAGRQQLFAGYICRVRRRLVM